LAISVFGVLERHTSFPWPVLKSQCRKNGIDPTNLTPATLGAVIQDLALAVGRFNSMTAGLAVRRELVSLLRAETGGLP
jgi:hypothetical protein